ncbi:MAG: hypothetical protein M3Q71_07780 [Chloroflexota bacterium]|nr:hypothetical protein [Chloroflexota bacterium]
MPLTLVNLDERTRQFMRKELDRDIAQNQLYVSPRLSTKGSADWPAILGAAIDIGDDAALARDLRASGRLNVYESRRTSHGSRDARRG